MKKLLFAIFTLIASTGFAYAQSSSLSSDKGAVWALKTNAVYWATTTPNIGAEVRLAPKWTLEAEVGLNPFTGKNDDGSYGRQGVVTAPLKELLESGEQYDEVIAIGPVIMMKFVVETVKPFGVPVTVSMNPIMIDGTGMCGGCRLTVGGKTRFACVDGPDFNGYEVDFDEAMERSTMYADFERREREDSCNLFKKEMK